MLRASEGAPRGLQKLLRPRPPLSTETASDADARQAAIDAYRDALEHEVVIVKDENGHEIEVPSPAKAAKNINTYIGRSWYGPLKRSVKQTRNEKKAAKADRIAKNITKLIQAIDALRKDKAIDELEEALEHLRMRIVELPVKSRQLTDNGGRL